MTKSPEARTSALQYDGNMPNELRNEIIVNSPLITTHTAMESGHFLVPYNCEIISAKKNVIEASGTAPGTLYAGIVSDVNKFIADYAVTTTEPLGVSDATLASTTVNAGDIIVFGSDGAATTTGLVTATLVLRPALT